MARAQWYSTELLNTFNQFCPGPDPLLGSVLVVPSSVPGDFRVTLQLSARDGDVKVLWDRSAEESGGFPELRTLKGGIRDEIASRLDLGHSEPKPTT